MNFKWALDKIMKFYHSYFNKSKLSNFFLNILLEQLEQSEQFEQSEQITHDVKSADNIKLQMISNLLTISNCRWYQTVNDIKSHMISNLATISNCRWSEQSEKEKDSVRNSTLTLWKSHWKKIILRSVMWLTCNMSL